MPARKSKVYSGITSSSLGDRSSSPSPPIPLHSLLYLSLPYKHILSGTRLHETSACFLDYPCPPYDHRAPLHPLQSSWSHLPAQRPTYRHPPYQFPALHAPHSSLPSNPPTTNLHSPPQPNPGSNPSPPHVISHSAPSSPSSKISVSIPSETRPSSSGQTPCLLGISMMVRSKDWRGWR